MMWLCFAVWGLALIYFTYEAMESRSYLDLIFNVIFEGIMFWFLYLLIQ
jgi:hypothetical protein